MYSENELYLIKEYASNKIVNWFINKYNLQTFLKEVNKYERCIKCSKHNVDYDYAKCNDIIHCPYGYEEYPDYDKVLENILNGDE